MKIALSTFCLLLGAAFAPQVCSAKALPEPPVVDYLLQDVCVDSRDAVVAGDPARCANHRDIRVGEAVPYLLTDYDPRSGQTFQATASIPVQGRDGQRMVLVLKLLQGSFGPGYRFGFSPARDAYDLIDLDHSPYASIVRTFDGGCFDQLFSRNGKRAGLTDRAGGWVLFPLQPAPNSWPATQSLRLTTWRIELSSRKPVCADNHATGLTRWARPAPVTFESGRTLTAIRTDHFAAADLSAPENSFERTYFTREYGMTRWEAWQTLAYCRRNARNGDPQCTPTSPANPWRSRCSRLKDPTTGLEGVAEIGGQTWVRVACRDQTHLIALSRAQRFTSARIGRENGVVDLAASQ